MLIKFKHLPILYFLHDRDYDKKNLGLLIQESIYGTDIILRICQSIKDYCVRDMFGFYLQSYYRKSTL